MRCREQAAIIRGFAHDVDATLWVNSQQPENGGGPSSGQVQSTQAPPSGAQHH